MKRYALVKNGLVLNVVLSDEENLVCAGLEVIDLSVDDPPHIGPGFIMLNGQWENPKDLQES